MKVKTIFKENESFSISDYLKKFGIKDTKLFCNPNSSCMESPENYDNIESAFELFNHHLELKSKIGIVVDVDLDGYTSASIIHRYIKEISPPTTIVPLFHKRRVHGINDADILKQIKDNEIEFLIVPDAGSNDYETHKKLNIPILVLDHHDCDKYSEDAIVVNNQLSDNVINKSASGALVTWKFCKYCDMKYGTTNASKLMELVYFSLISDIMDMRSLENRFIASWYLDRNHIKNKLFKELINNNVQNEIITNRDIAFGVTPKLSSIIRSNNLNLQIKLLVSLIYGDLDLDDVNESINSVISESKKVYNEQKKMVDSYYEKHIDDVLLRNIICEETGIESEFRGLVASKYASHFNRPVLLYNISKDRVTVSLRANYDVKDFINSSGLITLLGHGSAAGGVVTNENLPKLIEWCKTAKIPEPCYEVTQTLDATSINPNLFTLTKGYETIFGKNIEHPEFHINNILIKTKDIKELGNGSTVKFSYRGVDYIKFFCSKKEREDVFFIGTDTEIRVEIIGKLSENEWRGNITPQVIIEKIETKKVDKNHIVVSDLF